jgi:nitroreductase
MSMAEEKSIFKEQLKMNYSEDAGEPHPKEFQEIVNTRRSVRVFQREKIPESVMQECLDLTLSAPNSSNLQPWEFYWIRSEDKRAELNKAYLSQPAVKTCAELVIAVARTKTWQRNRKLMLESLAVLETRPPKAVFYYYEKLALYAYTQGWFSVIGLIKRIAFFFIGFFTPVPREPVSRHGMQMWAVKSTALACENLMLAMRAYGYDTCPMEGVDSVRVKKILNLPSDAVHVMGIACGKRASNGVYGPRIRFDKKLFVKEV